MGGLSPRQVPINLHEVSRRYERALFAAWVLATALVGIAMRHVHYDPMTPAAIVTGGAVALPLVALWIRHKRWRRRSALVIARRCTVADIAALIPVLDDLGRSARSRVLDDIERALRDWERAVQHADPAAIPVGLAPLLRHRAVLHGRPDLTRMVLDALIAKPTLSDLGIVCKAAKQEPPPATAELMKRAIDEMSRRLRAA